MTKVYSILVYNCNVSNNEVNSLPIQISEVFDLSEYGFLTRGTIKEYIRFASRNLASRTGPNQHQNIKYQPEDSSKDLDIIFYACCATSIDNISVVVITNDTYDLRVAHVLIKKVLEKVGNNITNYDKDTNIDYGLNILLKQFQKPEQIDNIAKINQDLDETKEVLVDGINSLLLRGEKLDDLVKKSEDLSFASKAFHQKSKDLNRCCNII